MQGIGVDADQAYLGPQIMTSALKKIDQAVLDAIKARPGRQVQGRRHDVRRQDRRHRLSARRNADGAKYADQVNEVQDKIAAGKITDIPDTVEVE